MLIWSFAVLHVQASVRWIQVSPLQYGSGGRPQTVAVLTRATAAARQNFTVQQPGQDTTAKLRRTVGVHQHAQVLHLGSL